MQELSSDKLNGQCNDCQVLGPALGGTSHTKVMRGGIVVSIWA